MSQALKLTNPLQQPLETIGYIPRAASRVATANAYRPPKLLSPIRLQLDRNEGRPPVELDEWISAANRELVRRYPNSSSLTEQLANRHGVNPEQILVTAGGDESLQRICFAFLDVGTQMILPSPTFEMLAKYGSLAGAEIVNVHWAANHFPVSGILNLASDRTRIVAVVSPNNPSGAVVTPSELRLLAESLPSTLILVDAAYGEFAAEDLTGLALQFPNTVVVRTFSKAWGMAGLRIGYTIGRPETIELLRRAGGPYPTSTLSEAIAYQALKNFPTGMPPYVSAAIKERSELTNLLRRFEINVIESQGNFVFLQTEHAEAIWRQLGELEIAVRWFGDHAELGNSLRISCPGDDAEFAYLRSSLESVLQNLPKLT